ncbi:NYN domain-containing protein [Pusillimonas noertemannii]|nr:NYN domain-containing protein [Pusillimonas noertemannii]TFL11915.1 NYN domain-containing protein [Pusillimonas noertemannii]
MMRRTAVYVDGFNLYYSTLKGTKYKWLDLKELCQRVLRPENDIVCIKYFTADVSPKPSDPDMHIRQQIFFRALRAQIRELEIIKGQFSSHVVTKKLHPPINGQRHATVLETKEKGSDVNLAVHLINDAWLDRFDCAIVISGDSDLAESMRLVKTHHPKKIIGLLTSKRGTSKEMVKCADFTRYISTSALANSQMPDIVIPNLGNPIRKPADW